MANDDRPWQSWLKDLSLDPASSSIDPKALHKAALATRLGTLLATLGWRPHQSQRSVTCHEPESQGALPLSPAAQATADRIQSLFDESVSFLPPPTCSARHHSVLADDSGALRLPFASTERPSEETRSMTDGRSAVPIWSSLVQEIASGWASNRTGRSSGLCFLGPKDRLCYWPRLLNSMLSHVAVSYGSVFDLFTVAASCGVKFDLKSAFRALPIAAEDAVFLGAMVDGIWVVFERLPFGLACSPAYFVSALDATLSKFRSSSPDSLLALAAISVFVDDVGVAGSSPEDGVGALGQQGDLGG